MYKVFLVEDEIVIREGIKNKIDWTGNGYEFCGEASDGELAYPMIQKCKPDIVITDIKMPFMDGLELSTLLRKEMPWIEIIILSGFAEFEYAQKAISLGVAQFLSKPINSEELLSEVDKVAKKLDRRREEEKLKEKYKREIEENYLNGKKDLFQHLVSGDKSTTALLAQAADYDINLSALWYNIVLFTMWSNYHTEQEYSGTKENLRQIITNFCKEKEYILFDRDLEGYALLLKADSEEALNQLCQECILQLETILKEYTNMSYFGGIGNSVNRLSELPKSFEQASHALARRYLLDDNSFAVYDTRHVSEQETSLDISAINARQVDRGEILQYLKMANPGEAPYFVEEYFNKLDKEALKSMLFRQYIAMDVYFCTVDFLQGLGYEKSSLPAMDVGSRELQSVEGTIDCLTNILQTAARLRMMAANNKYADVVDEVITYIEEHYGEDELSLNQVASKVNLSPNHLSTIFSQKTGKTFIKFLTDYRMMKAKELLKCSNKRSSVIALEVGYRDSHYFSFLFKKTQGMTPTQFRGEKE